MLSKLYLFNHHYQTKKPSRKILPKLCIMKRALKNYVLRDFFSIDL